MATSSSIALSVTNAGAFTNRPNPASVLVWRSSSLGSRALGAHAQPPAAKRPAYAVCSPASPGFLPAARPWRG